MIDISNTHTTTNIQIHTDIHIHTHIHIHTSTHTYTHPHTVTNNKKLLNNKQSKDFVIFCRLLKKKFSRRYNVHHITHTESRQGATPDGVPTNHIADSGMIFQPTTRFSPVYTSK